MTILKDYPNKNKYYQSWRLWVGNHTDCSKYLLITTKDIVTCFLQTQIHQSLSE